MVCWGESTSQSGTAQRLPSRRAGLLPRACMWRAVRCQLASSVLLQAGRPGLVAKERAVAVRSLLVSTSSEKPDIALNKALDDVERYRRLKGCP